MFFNFFHFPILQLPPQDAQLRLAAVVGLGYAYAGSCREDSVLAESYLDILMIYSNIVFSLIYLWAHVCFPLICRSVTGQSVGQVKHG